MKSSHPRLLFVTLLLLLSACSLFPSPCAADGVGPFALDASCLGGPNEESGSVFSITSIITVRLAPADACSCAHRVTVHHVGGCALRSGIRSSRVHFRQQQ